MGPAEEGEGKISLMLPKGDNRKESYHVIELDIAIITRPTGSRRAPQPIINFRNIELIVTVYVLLRPCNVIRVKDPVLCALFLLPPFLFSFPACLLARTLSLVLII